MVCPLPDVVCFSHLRWDFVFQRPHHLMTRYAKAARVSFLEEPTFGGGEPALQVAEVEGGVRVLTPHLPAPGDPRGADEMQRALLERYLAREGIHAPLFWFYTPMALGLGRDIEPSLVVYDCMDELSGFLGAPPALTSREEQLFRRADIVFTGGQSIYEAKRSRHPNVHAFPSSVDADHFRAARKANQTSAARGPRVGFFGVIDERLDIALLDGVARARPDVEFVLVGPTVKIDPAALPVRSNIHYLGPRPYADLPACIETWDVAMMPFALNDATRFISPTKTLEYMAAGKPIVSTPIRDVVRPYGEEGLVRIAGDVASFAAAIDEALAEDGSRRLAAFDGFLAGTSWDRTWQRMSGLLAAAIGARAARTDPRRQAETA
jgi:glycosyltransferase involved in cell wall biosynthesis